MIDLSRLPDWTDAVDAYRQGNSEKLADFIREHGVEKGYEAAELAELLTKKPDARAGAKKQTQLMLIEVNARVRHRDAMKGVIAAAHERRARLAIRLARRGWKEAQIVPALNQRFAWAKTYLLPTDWEIYEAVGQNWGMDAESVKRARLRQKATNVKDTN